jgi:hypothetical protein
MEENDDAARFLGFAPLKSTAPQLCAILNECF